MSQESKIMAALTVDCPNCMSLADQPCTQPTDTGRRKVRWVHHARVHAGTTKKLS